MNRINVEPVAPSCRFSIEVPIGYMAFACGPFADVDALCTPSQAPLSIALVQKNEKVDCALPNIIMASFKTETEALRQFPHMSSYLRPEFGPIVAFLASSQKDPAFLPKQGAPEKRNFRLLAALVSYAFMLKTITGQKGFALDLREARVLDPSALAARGIYRKGSLQRACDKENEAFCRGKIGRQFKSAVQSFLLCAFDLRDGIPAGYVKIAPRSQAPKEAARLES